MGHVTKRTAWCDIDIDTTLGHVFLQERWQYDWRVQPLNPPLSPWTYEEKRAFHNGADRRIWGVWSNRTRFSVHGRSIFADRFRRQGVTINLDIQWVLSNPHWKVTVTKIPKGAQETSSAVWGARTLELDSEDLTPRLHQQIPVTHEFGHAAGNTSTLGRGDEYAETSPHIKDARSVMHSGRELRDRHFRTIIDELDTMIAGTTFSVRSVQ